MTTYYINNATGLDTNPGTSASPFKTFAPARAAAVAAGLPSTAPMTVVFQGNYAGNIVVDWPQASQDGSCQVALQSSSGRTNVLHSSTFTAASAYVPGIIGSGGAYGVLTDTTTNFSSYVGDHFVMTSGAYSGQVGIIVGIVPGTSNNSVYFLPLTSASPYEWPPGKNTPGVGDAYSIYGLTTITGQLVVMPSTNVAVMDLAFDNSATTGNIVEACGNSTLITQGCLLKGQICTQRGGYWQAQMCHFQFTGGQSAIVVGAAGMFDNFGNLFNGGFMELNEGATTDVVGDAVVYGSSGNPSVSMNGGSELRMPFGTNQSGWLCFLETIGPAFYIEGPCVVACEQNVVWGHLTGGSAFAIQVAEGGKFFYNGATYAPKLSGYTNGILAAANVTWAAPANVPPNGCLWDMNLATQQQTGVAMTEGNWTLTPQQLLCTSIEASGVPGTSNVTIVAGSTPTIGSEWTCRNNNTTTGVTTFFGLALANGKSMRVRVNSVGGYEQVTAAN
jgi:hypothetical protein